MALTYCVVSLKSEVQIECMRPDYTNYDLYDDLQLENYSSLRETELRWIEVIYYSAVQIPTDFHEKFKHVKEIRVSSRVYGEDRLIEFIKGSNVSIRSEST